MTEELFKIRVTVNGQVYEGNGETMVEAVQSVPRPSKVSTKGIVSVQYGDKSKQMVFTPMRLRKFFQPISKHVMAKFLSYGL